MKTTSIMIVGVGGQGLLRDTHGLGLRRRAAREDDERGFVCLVRLALLAKACRLACSRKVACKVTDAGTHVKAAVVLDAHRAGERTHGVFAAFGLAVVAADEKTRILRPQQIGRIADAHAVVNQERHSACTHNGEEGHEPVR